MRNPSETIAFRASPELLRRIDACRGEGQSRGAWARQVIEQKAYNVEADGLAMRIEELAAAVEQLGIQQELIPKLIRRGVLILLVKGGDQMEQAEAQRFLARHLRLPQEE